MSPLHGLTLGDVLREHGRSRPGQTAAIDGDRRLTYAALDERVNRLANALRDAGVGGGDRILWLGQNSFRLLECLLAASKLGAYFCAANWRQSAEELAFVLDDMTAAVVVHQAAEIGDAVQAARSQSAAGSARWIQHDNGEYEAFVASGSADDLDLPVESGEAVLLMYTAAFSGRPNAAMLSVSPSSSPRAKRLAVFATEAAAFLTVSTLAMRSGSTVTPRSWASSTKLSASSGSFAASAASISWAARTASK